MAEVSSPNRRQEVLQPFGGQATQSYVFVYAFQLPFLFIGDMCDDFRIIKIGISANPGRRLYDLGQAMDRLSDSTVDHFKLNFPRASGGLGGLQDFIKEVKQRDEIIFVVGVKIKKGNPTQKIDQCPYSKKLESAIQRIMSFILIGDFVESFVANSDQNLLKYCCTTEWFVCKKSVAQILQQHFRSGLMDGDTIIDGISVWLSLENLAESLNKVLPRISSNLVTKSRECVFAHAGDTAEVRVYRFQFWGPAEDSEE